ncbi:hypothetical protein BD626DRAFT_520816, partial [Schizophyllum amplum]
MGIKHARALTRSESAPLLGDSEDDAPQSGPPKALASGAGALGNSDIAPINELSSSSRVGATAPVAFCIAGALNIAAACWMIVQASPERALFAAGVAGVLLLSGAMNMGAAAGPVLHPSLPADDARRIRRRHPPAASLASEYLPLLDLYPPRAPYTRASLDYQ